MRFGERIKSFANSQGRFWEKVKKERKNKGYVTLWPLPFTLKCILIRQKKNYENSNISPCKKIIFAKIL
jgi:hypothetical protein